MMRSIADATAASEQANAQGSAARSDDSLSKHWRSKVACGKHRRMRPEGRADPKVAVIEATAPLSRPRQAAAQSSTSIGLTRVAVIAEALDAGPIRCSSKS